MTIEEAIRILDPETSRAALEPYRMDCALRLAVLEEACRLAVRELAEAQVLRSQNEQLREANALTVKATTDRLCREWISVEKRLPHFNQPYIVTACDENAPYGEGIWYSTVVVVAEYYNGCWTWYEGTTEYDLTGLVTHWMPLPEPPSTEASPTGQKG